jgi:hypothetical protein
MRITPLYVIVGTGNFIGVKNFFESGADINALDNGNDILLDAVGDRFFS